jgi:hypothetical protein
MTGAQAVVRAEPDGYTVLYDASAFAVNPALRKMAFDPGGDRPAGKMAVTSAVVQIALAAASVQGRTPALDSAHSTDANLPMSLGIPAIPIGCGGASSGIHSAKK